MAIETLSYSKAGSGWNSFHSFIPDLMIGLNSTLYTWKNGDLYKHDDNAVRNNYYGTQYTSTITPILNDNPIDNKIYKTLYLDSNSAWQADMNTDLDDQNGVIETDYYKLKEGAYFAYIRRDDNTVDLSAMSTQGLGEATYSALVFTFAFDLAASISVGDAIWASSDPFLTPLALVGTILSHTSTTITVNAAAYTPSNGDFVVAVKNSMAESVGARGSYLEVKLTNTDTTSAELFLISAETYES